MDPDQTTPVCFQGFKYYSGQQKENTFCDYALKGLINVSLVCLRLGFKYYARTQLINSSPNYK